MGKNADVTRDRSLVSLQDRIQEWAPKKSTGALRVYLENKRSEKDKSTSRRVGHGQTQRGNNREPLL